MFRALLLSFAALAFAGQVLAMELVLGGMVGNITTSQMLQVPPGPYVDACKGQCEVVNTTIVACNEVNSCLCTADIANQLTACEQCMFNTLVAMNMKQPDPRVGTNAGLTAFSTACNSSTLPKIALTIAPNWDGSMEIILGTPAAVVVVGFGAILGGSAILLMSNL